MHRCIGTRRGSNSRSESDHTDILPVECYACTRVGAPNFHSTRYHPGDEPEWEASAGSCLFPVENKCSTCSTGNQQSSRPFDRVLDPRSKSMKRLNRLIVLTRGVSLAVDPIFLFAISITGGNRPCIYIDCSVAAFATVLRTCVDAVHLFHLWLQFRLAYVSKESLVIGNGKLVWDARAIVAHYVRSFKGFWFDAFVILPIPQIVYWLVLPKLLKENYIEEVITITQFIFLLQFLPKVYHSIHLMRGMRKVTGYIFGTVWWGFALNLIAYFLASHASGGFWYILSIQRLILCLTEQCNGSEQCDALSFTCPREICYSAYGNPCNGNSTMKVDLSKCIHKDGGFPYGLYALALPVISENSIIVQILYSNLWGLMAISTMGNNLEPTSQCLEVTFAIIMVLAGLSLFTMLIGNIQVFLHAVTVRRRKMQLRYRDMEWWMKRRQLPSRLRQRVRQFEHQIWTIMGGQNEMELIKDLPDGLRRDIKRYLCLDLVKKVPLFHNLDDLILDHICDRVKPIVFSKDEKILREGEPVQRMVFIVRGRIVRSQNLSKSMMATSLIDPGGFFGDELLSWCLRRTQNINRFPTSSATFTCIDPTEAFGLDSDHLLYITDHFRYTFSNNKLKSTTRYYSSNWRTWAAVNIQLAWRRYLSNRNSGNVSATTEIHDDQMLRHYASIFMSLRPHDHLE